jgi:hypothetical protein
VLYALVDGRLETSLFSHMSASFIRKARHLENVRTGSEKRKRDEYTLN